MSPRGNAASHPISMPGGAERPGRGAVRVVERGGEQVFGADEGVAGSRGAVARGLENPCEVGRGQTGFASSISMMGMSSSMG